MEGVLLLTELCVAKSKIILYFFKVLSKLPYTYIQCSEFDSTALLEIYVIEYFEESGCRTKLELCQEFEIVASDNDQLLASNDSP